MKRLGNLAPKIHTYFLKIKYARFSMNQWGFLKISTSLQHK